MVLIERYERLYGLRRACLIIGHCILSACIVFLVDLSAPNATRNLELGLRSLRDITVNHALADRCIKILISLAKKWNLELPPNVKAALDDIGTESKYSPSRNHDSYPFHGQGLEQDQSGQPNNMPPLISGYSHNQQPQFQSSNQGFGTAQITDPWSTTVPSQPFAMSPMPSVTPSGGMMPPPPPPVGSMFWNPYADHAISLQMPGDHTGGPGKIEMSMQNSSSMSRQTEGSAEAEQFWKDGFRFTKDMQMSRQSSQHGRRDKRGMQ